jgi:hypothetical protein
MAAYNLFIMVQAVCAYDLLEHDAKVEGSYFHVPKSLTIYLQDELQ